MQLLMVRLLPIHRKEGSMSLQIAPIPSLKGGYGDDIDDHPDDGDDSRPRRRDDDGSRGDDDDDDDDRGSRRRSRRRDSADQRLSTRGPRLLAKLELCS